MKSIRAEFDKRIQKHLYHYYWESLGLFDWKARVESRKNEVPRATALLKTIEQISGTPLRGKKMLDIGCGWGAFVIAALEMGIDACGCDVDKEVLEVATLRSKLHQVPENYFTAPAEKLPFSDEEFDYVQCNTVLEHVSDVSLAIKELVRVLKKGAVGFIQAPNYWQPVERHYKILFPPKCPKILGKMYLGLLARPVEFLDTINYIDYKGIKTELEGCGAEVEDIEKAFCKVFNSLYKQSEAISAQSTDASRSYRALITKIMWRLSPAVIKFVEQRLHIRQIYFLVRKH